MNRRVMLLLIPLLFLPTQAEEIYRRVDLLETRTGIARLRVVYNPRLNVPVGCEDGTQDCLEGVRFTRLYALKLGLETRRAVDGGTRIVWDDKGELFLALQFDTEDEEWFDEALRDYLSSLSADAFAEEYARMEGAGSPLREISARSPDTSWSCFRGGEAGKVTRYDGFIVRNEDGTILERSGGISSFPLTDKNPQLASNQQFCDEMSETAASAFPDEVRTMPVPRYVVETVVEHSGSNTLRAEAYEEDLVPLPGESRFTKKKNPGMLSSSSSSGDGKFKVLGRGKDGIMRIAHTEPAEIRPDAVADNRWLTRWRVRTEERNLGPHPGIRVLSEAMLTMALVPTTPSVEVDGNDEPLSIPVSGRPYEIRFDETAFMDEIARHLDRESILDLATLERALTIDPSGFESEGWIQVICRPDGSALYGIVPTGVKTRLLNADLFCAAVESQLP